MNEIVKVFENQEFGEIRTIVENDKVLFCGSDVAKALGYSNTRDAILRHCRGVVKRDGVSKSTNQFGTTTNQTTEMSFLPEGDIYRLIAHSKLPAAEQFERWVFDEVLPTIRKTGGYVNNDDNFIATYLPFADENTKLLFKSTLMVIQNQNKQLEEQKPLVEFANTVAKSCDNILMRDMAKLLCEEHISIGETRLFRLLRSKGVLMSGNDPYQSYVNRGYFVVKEAVYQTPYGEKLNRTTLVTPRGQIWMVSKVKEWMDEAA